MPPLPLSTCLINSGPFGGLAQLGNSTLTSPGLSFPAGELVKRLQDDLDKWPLPLLDGKVVAVEHLKNHFKLTLEDGRQLTALAVIMACGMLDIRNMATFWRQGVVATFGNRQNIYSILGKELPGCKHPLVLGGPHLLKLHRTIQKNNSQTTFLVPPLTKLNSNCAEAVIAGELVSLEKENNKLSLAVLKTKSGIVKKAVDKVVIEFNSLELERGPLPDGIPCHANGFMENSGNGQTLQQGLFTAGDCTGPPFSALVALGQGAEAAFEAYRYAHKIKYGKQPALFAYYGDQQVTDSLSEKEDFPLADDMIPARLLGSCPAEEFQEIWPEINGQNTLSNLALKTGYSIDVIFELIRKLIKERALTFCPFQ